MSFASNASFTLRTTSTFSRDITTSIPRLKQPSVKVSDRTRTGDRLDHNQELYQLSYAHQAGTNLAPRPG